MYGFIITINNNGRTLRTVFRYWLSTHYPDHPGQSWVIGKNKQTIQRLASGPDEFRVWATSDRLHMEAIDGNTI